ncbi:MAG: hypothetical protein J7J32_03685, partial [Candidatus Atribacteria bacterium]|nr:hypothetical protein [Candidatus Atribacteria bacterium]MCD6349800.1 hypothetical protein [Candidatus Atribacteria bacterium]
MRIRLFLFLQKANRRFWVNSGQRQEEQVRIVKIIRLMGELHYQAKLFLIGFSKRWIKSKPYAPIQNDLSSSLR